MSSRGQGHTEAREPGAARLARPKLGAVAASDLDARAHSQQNGTSGSSTRDSAKDRVAPAAQSATGAQIRGVGRERGSEGFNTESWHGVPALIAAGANVEVVVLPERGGKIASLRTSSGREWLEQPALPLSPSLPHKFVEGDMCGWDECAPSIVECDWRGVHIPDHGELWSGVWSSEPDGSLTIAGRCIDYIFQRRIAVFPSWLIISYRVRGGTPGFPFLWASHPQFRAEAGTRVVLPDHVTELVDVSRELPSRAHLEDIILGIDQVPLGESRKWYVAPEAQISEASLVHPDQETVRLRWTSAVPYLGIWVDNCHYARNAVIALEPSTGFYDSCVLAEAGGTVARLGSHGSSLEWTLSLWFGLARDVPVDLDMAESWS